MGHVRKGRLAKEERRLRIKERLQKVQSRKELVQTHSPQPKTEKCTTAKKSKCASDLQHKMAKEQRAFESAAEYFRRRYPYSGKAGK